jgi:steroid delta-isomerase-like uncharacterized protein
MSDSAAVVGAFVDAWERNDPEAILALLSADCVWYDGVPSEPYVGRDAIAPIVRRYSRHISDVAIEVVHQAVAGPIVFQERVDRGRRDGKPFAIEAVCVFEVNDGLITANRDYWNPGAYRADPARGG